MSEVMAALLRDYLYAAIYSHSCRFANIERFVNSVSGVVELDGEISPDKAADALHEIASRIEPPGVVTNETSAYMRLVAADLHQLATTNFSTLDLSDSLEERLSERGAAIQIQLARIGLDVDDVSVHVVDRFPEPFHRFDWSAFAPDREDEDRYGVKRGVYFRRDRVRPLYSEALFAHEVVHTITGRVDPEIYAMGLEEGIAEAIGTCYAALAVLPKEILRNILTYGRHGVSRQKLWSVYLAHTRQAYLLFNEFGLTGLAELARRGRAAIQRAEALLMSGTHRRLLLPAGEYDEESRHLLEFVSCAYLPSHVFSPLECLLAAHVASGLSIDEVCDRAGVPKKLGAPVLAALGAKSALFVQSGSTIGYSNVEHYRELEYTAGVRVIRYLPLG